MHLVSGLSEDFYPPGSPLRPLRRPWQEPPTFPPTPIISDDVVRLLRRILERLDAIEKRLDRIEKALIAKQP